MINADEIRDYVKDLSPSDVERAIKYSETSMDDAIIAYMLFLEQKKIPRQIFIQGYNAMYAAASLFLAKRYKVKLAEEKGGTHKNMRLVLEFYARDSKHYAKLIQLYETALEMFKFLNEQYRDERHFAKKVVTDLMEEGYYQGKKITYYHEKVLGRKDPLELTVSDARKFIDEIVKPFLFIMKELTND